MKVFLMKFDWNILKHDRGQFLKEAIKGGKEGSVAVIEIHPGSSQRGNTATEANSCNDPWLMERLVGVMNTCMFQSSPDTLLNYVAVSGCPWQL